MKTKIKRLTNRQKLHRLIRMRNYIKRFLLFEPDDDFLCTKITQYVNLGVVYMGLCKIYDRLFINNLDEYVLQYQIPELYDKKTTSYSYCWFKNNAERMTALDACINELQAKVKKIKRKK